MSTGTVKRIIRERGFGFISAEDGREIFFHRTELQDIEFDDIGEGDQLEFTIVKGKKGPQAIGVKKPSGQEASDQEPSDQEASDQEPSDQEPSDKEASDQEPSDKVD
jgi:CspA family cold shock protein